MLLMVTSNVQSITYILLQNAIICRVVTSNTKIKKERKKKGLNKL